MVYISEQAVLQTKLAQLRDRKLNSRETRQLVAEIAGSFAAEVMAKVFERKDPEEKDRSNTVTSDLGHAVVVPQLKPTDSEYVIAPVLRSGQAMLDPFLAQLPAQDDPAVYHLGLYREESTLSPVEYYNKLPPPLPTVTSKISHAFVLDPVIATGGTAKAVVEILKEWGVENIVIVSLIASKQGIEKLAQLEGVEVYVVKGDEGLTEQGFLVPGIGDIGDRLFATKKVKY